MIDIDPMVRELLERADAATAVERQRVTKLEARVERLTAEILKLKRQGFAAIPAKKRTRASEDVERRAVQRAELQAVRQHEVEFRANATRALVAEGVPEHLAAREAKKLFEHATSLHDPG